jgi:DNA polymerase III epsilon subunit-like protein
MDEHLLRFDKSKTFLFIDCETFNLCLNFCHNLPWQIAMLKCQGDRIIESKDIHLRWKTHLKISKDAAKITRFDPKTIEKKGIDPEAFFPTLKDWIDKTDYIVGHNIIGFDLYIINEYYKFMEIEPVDLLSKSIDTNLLYKGIKTGKSYNPKKESLQEYMYKLYHTKFKNIRTNLTATGKDLNIQHDYDSLHNALSDLELNFKVWNKIKYMVNI